MKAFFLGMIGSLFALLLVAIVVPLYSDYEDRAYTENAITIIKPLKDEISNQILLNKKVEVQVEKYTSRKEIQKMHVFPEGHIAMKVGENGQILILFLEIKNGKISWSCLGGFNETMPPECRNT